MTRKHFPQYSDPSAMHKALDWNSVLLVVVSQVVVIGVCLFAVVRVWLHGR